MENIKEETVSETAYKVVTTKNKSCVLKSFKNIGLVKTYKKGSVVKAVFGTPGIFCFKTKNRAEEYLKNVFPDWYNYKVILVEGVAGRPAPDYLPFPEDINIFNVARKSKNPGVYKIRAPKETVCYASVKVLEDGEV